MAQSRAVRPCGWMVGGAGGVGGWRRHHRSRHTLDRTGSTHAPSPHLRVSKLNVRPTRQQHAHHLCVIAIGRCNERRPAEALLHHIDARAAREEQLGELPVAAKGGRHERRGAIHVHGVHVHACVERRGHPLELAAGGSQDAVDLSGALRGELGEVVGHDGREVCKEGG